MRQVIQFSISNEAGRYTAFGINAPIVADGGTFEELEKNIQEAVSLYLEEMNENERESVPRPAVIANFEFPEFSYA